jgi:hypothetical protein
MVRAHEHPGIEAALPKDEIFLGQRRIECGVAPPAKAKLIAFVPYKSDVCDDR